ncbi:MAG: hypothetical protein LH480_15925 [Rubrivivax sp.]|nr:hypothetical protein [Rubrivivax sp.]
MTPTLADLAAVAAYAPALAQAFASLACDLALVLDAQGKITRVAHGPASTLTQATADWVGRLLVDAVTPDTRHKIDSLLAEAATAGLARRREVNLPVADGPTIPLAFTALRLGPDGPMLAAGHDLRAVALMQQRFVRVQQELERSYGLALGAGGPATAPATAPAPGQGFAHAPGPAFGGASGQGSGPTPSEKLGQMPGQMPGQAPGVLPLSVVPAADVTEHLNEASRAAFAAWLQAEQLAGEGPLPPWPRPAAAPLARGPRKPGAGRKT